MRGGREIYLGKRSNDRIRGVPPGFRLRGSAPRGPLPGSLLACPSPKTTWGRDDCAGVASGPRCPLRGPRDRVTALPRDAEAAVREGGLPALPAAGFNPPSSADAMMIRPHTDVGVQSAKADFVLLLQRIHSPRNPVSGPVLTRQVLYCFAPPNPRVASTAARYRSTCRSTSAASHPSPASPAIRSATTRATESPPSRAS